MFMWRLQVLRIFSEMLLKTLPTYLIVGLASVMRKVYRLKIWHEQGQGKNPNIMQVYDLVNCGPNHRFHTSTGLIAHNCLGLGYGMQARKLVNTAYENGHIITFNQAKAFYQAYWQLFSRVRRLSDQLEKQVMAEGELRNEFGYRMTPEPRKAFNYLIQSSVSGVIHVFLAKLKAAAPYMHLVTIIHDELLVEIPKDKVEEFRMAKERAADSLNEDLKWTVNIRTGFAMGNTWYEAK